MNVRGLASAVAASLALTALAAAPVASGHESGTATEVPAASSLGQLRIGPAPKKPTYVPAPSSAGRRSAATASFGVSYTGFTPEAQAAFQRAVDIWATKISSPVKIYVNAKFEDMGDPRILGGARAGKNWANFAGAPVKNVGYPDAIANKLAGKQLYTGSDIFISFNSQRSDLHFGEGPAPAGKYDFTSIVLHELGHGLGTSGFGRVVGNLGSVRGNVQGGTNVPMLYDRYTQNSSGTFLTGYGDPSSTLAQQLQSNKLYFTSSKVRAANDGRWAKIYAPATFEPGSSYSHLDEATFPAGDPNSLMTPKIGPGETIRDPGPITLAIYDTIGW